MNETRLPSQELRHAPPAISRAVPVSFDDSPEVDVELRQYLKVVMKYRLLIGAFVGVSTVLALLYAFTVAPRYSAESTVRISTYEPILTATKIEDMLQEKSKESNYLETQVQEMKSYSLADKVLEDKELKEALTAPAKEGFFSSIFGLSGNEEEAGELPDGVSGYKAPIRELRKYLQSVEIKPVRRTALVNIQATANEPKLAALAANRHAAAYMDWVRENRIDQQSRGLSFLKGQAEELRERVADLERELADYAEANSIVAVNKDENITAQRMAQLNKLLTDASAQRIEAENLYEEANRALANPSAAFDDVSTQTMRSELAKLQGEYRQLSEKFTSSYPKMQQLAAQIEGMQKALEDQRRQIVLGLKAKMMAAQEAERNLREELEQQKSQAFELSKRQVQFNVLSRELTSSRDLLQNVLRQIKETSLAVESNASNVSIVDYAVTPRYPSYPKKKLLTLIGLLAGLAAGTGCAFLLNYLDNSLRTPEDVSQLLRLPSLGVVPSFMLETQAAQRQREAALRPEQKIQHGKELLVTSNENGLPPIAFVHDPRSLASEAYRTIRTGILLSQAGEPPRTILLTSAQSSEGKTTSSINLAASLASAGGKVVIVDADLRRPSLHKHFEMASNEPGLVEIITGQATVEQVAIRDVIKRVTVIKSGKIPPNPAELLGSLEMASLIDQLSEAFDYVIIDCPPILPVTDSVVLSRYVDGVVLVVRASSTPRKVVLDARNRLQGVGARLLGVVLNDVDFTGGDYYYYKRYYHSYYEEEARKTGSTGA